MDVQDRTELGIGYYYERVNGVIVYVPLERGKGAFEHWLDNDDDIIEWWKVSEYKEEDHEDIRNT